MKYRSLTGFDLETTGVNPLTARIVTSSIVQGTVRPDSSLDVTSHGTMLADPGCDIPQGASDVHGITTDYARTHGADHDVVLDSTIEHIRRAWASGSAVVVYNAAYDLTILRHWRPDFTIDGPVIDPMVIDKTYNRYRRGRRTCTAVAGHYGIAVDPAKAHQSEYDCFLAMNIAAQLDKNYDLPGPDEINDKQAAWHKFSMESLRDYFARSGKGDPDSVSFGWPFNTTLA